MVKKVEEFGEAEGFLEQKQKKEKGSGESQMRACFSKEKQENGAVVVKKR